MKTTFTLLIACVMAFYVEANGQQHEETSNLQELHEATLLEMESALNQAKIELDIAKHEKMALQKTFDKTKKEYKQASKELREAKKKEKEATKKVKQENKKMRLAKKQIKLAGN